MTRRPPFFMGPSLMSARASGKGASEVVAGLAPGRSGGEGVAQCCLLGAHKPSYLGLSPRKRTFLKAAAACHKAGFPFGIGLGTTEDSVVAVL